MLFAAHHTAAGWGAASRAHPWSAHHVVGQLLAPRRPAARPTHWGRLRAPALLQESEGVQISICDDGAEVYPRLPSGAAAKQGPRETMEDYLTVQEARFGFLFAGVYDGHNGDSSAQYLVKHFYQVFDGLLEQQRVALGGEASAAGPVCYPISIQNTLAESFRETDQKLLEWMREHARGDDANSGSTATAALVRKDALIVANVGDSRAVLCRGGQAVDLTTQHRVYGRDETAKAEIKRVQQGGGWVDDGRVCGVLAVSRAFGDPEFKGPGLERLLSRGAADGLWTKEFASSRRFTDDPVTVEPDVAVLALGEQDEFLVIATDGLWDVMGSQDVITLARTNLRKGQTPQEVAEKLAAVALKRYTADNVAVVVVGLQEQGSTEGAAATGTKAAGKSGGTGKKGGLFGLFK